MRTLFNRQKPLDKYLTFTSERIKKEVELLKKSDLDKKADSEICSGLLSKFRFTPPRVPALDSVEPKINDLGPEGPRRLIQYRVTYEIQPIEGEAALLEYCPHPHVDVAMELDRGSIVYSSEGSNAEDIKAAYASACKDLEHNLSSMKEEIEQHNAAIEGECKKALAERRQRLDNLQKFRNGLSGA
ncbi:hypothetical protein J7M28_13555 [bacterium]|nr:hypothetical protein [bacterium]